MSVWRVSEGADDPLYTLHGSAQEAADALRKIIAECSQIDGVRIEIEERDDLISGATFHVPNIRSRRIFAEEWSNERAEYVGQYAEGERVWIALIAGNFNPSFAAMWRPSSIKNVLADEYQVTVNDNDATDLYIALAPMIADIMQEANERVEARVTEILSAFASEVDGCPPEGE